MLTRTRVRSTTESLQFELSLPQFYALLRTLEQARGLLTRGRAPRASRVV
jgi:hypothetical protein